MGTAERFKRLEVQVLVVGAGPTGLTAANRRAALTRPICSSTEIGAAAAGSRT